MVVTSSASKQFNSFLQRFKKDYPGVLFQKNKNTYWDAHKQIIHYNPDQDNPLWSILHEIGHLECRHSSYSLDIELLVMEKDAWTEAKNIAKKYRLAIDNGYIEDCLDSYRDWLHKRSLCPKCKQTGVQTDGFIYHCINCRQRWKVSVSRFCRAYRKKVT